MVDTRLCFQLHQSGIRRMAKSPLSEFQQAEVGSQFLILLLILDSFAWTISQRKYGISKAHLRANQCSMNQPTQTTNSSDSLRVLKETTVNISMALLGCEKPYLHIRSRSHVSHLRHLRLDRFATKAFKLIVLELGRDETTLHPKSSHVPPNVWC